MNDGIRLVPAEQAECMEAVLGFISLVLMMDIEDKYKVNAIEVVFEQAKKEGFECKITISPEDLDKLARVTLSRAKIRLGEIADDDEQGKENSDHA